ncbi:hypothetical protein DFJ73DRAFT_959913 [Zopfochytrium polystomum]|nr:hypothetical protein DFJ73DRAFT_959913 [Zopfochytrium polystomum]
MIGSSQSPSSSSSSSSSSSAAARLMRDLKELVDAPVPGAEARPISDDNMLLWHGNLFGPNPPFDSTPLHVRFQFKPDYPASPPLVRLCSPLPHSNITNTPGGYAICLDMLETGKYADVSAGTGKFPYSGWSAAYTVRSILMQLQEFLLDARIKEAVANGSITYAERAAANFACPSCPHRGKPRPWPVPKIRAFDVAPAPAPIYIERPVIRDLMAARSRVKRQTASAYRPADSTQDLDDDEWISVGRANRQKEGKTEEDRKPKDQPVSATSGATSNPFEYLAKAADVSEAGLKTAAAPPSQKAAAVVVAAKSPVEAIPSPKKDKVKAEKPVARKKQIPVWDNIFLPTSAAAKNRKRHERRKANRALKREGEDVGRQRVSADRSVVVSDSTETAEKKDEIPTTPDSGIDISAPSNGPFDRLPYEVLHRILNHLPVASILTLSQVSRFFSTLTEDGYLWRELFSRENPASALKASSIGDWKHVYRMEVSGIVEDLCCFYTKKSYKEDVLGIPIEFTVNPVKGTVDYIHSTFDLISYSAFTKEKVRKTVWSESFTEWLPLYLTYDHFERALPHIKKAILRLCPHMKSCKFAPIMVLEVLPKLLNTQIVLLCDNGLHNSEAFLFNYFQIHRLLVELVHEFPQLQREIVSRLKAFGTSEATRHKDVSPNLGDIIPLPSLAKLLPLGPGAVEPERIRETFEGTKTSLRLQAVHATVMTHMESFYTSKSTSPQQAMARAQDLLFGRPPRAFIQSLRAKIAQVLSAEDYDTLLPWFHLPFSYLKRVPDTPIPAAGAEPSQPPPPPTPKYRADPIVLTRLLRTCVSTSLRRRYHTKDTNFRAIHRSGVSKILRRGQSYRCAPNIRSVVMEEAWRVGGASSFLDATALAYDASGGFVALCDYAHTSALDGALHHSGDVVTADRGSHRIRVALDKLPKSVRTVVFAMSAWTGTMRDVLDPEVRLFDGGADAAELCQYSFDECKKAGAADLSVIMCTLQKAEGSGLWKVEAIGSMGPGNARNYEPIKRTIVEKRFV